MKFSKYNNPNKKRRPKRVSPYSSSYIEERRKEMYETLARCETEAQKDAIIKAFSVSINP